MENCVRPDVSYKVLALGDCGVGKTSIIQNLAGREFSRTVRTTVAPDFVRVVFHVEDSLVELCIWDTPGHERFRSITRQQLKGVQGAALIYSIADKESFKLMEYWIDSLNEVSSMTGEGEEPLAVILIGNKMDLITQREVTRAQADKLTNRNMLIGFTESSAVTGEGLEGMFYRLAYFLTESHNPGLLRRFSPCVMSKENLLTSINFPQKPSRICHVFPHNREIKEEKQGCCCSIL